MTLRELKKMIYYQYSHVKNRDYFREWRERDGIYSLKGYDQLQCIFIHIPKTGGVSVSKSLFGNLGGGHKDIVFYKRAFGPLTYKKYFTFTFVRNPYTRLHSAYNFLKKGGLGGRDEEFSRTILSDFPTFGEFVNGWITNKSIYSYNHFIPQHHFLCDSAMEPDVDFIGRFENLAADFRKVTVKLGSTAELPHHNKTKDKKNRPEEVYTKELLKKVADIYSDDFKIFNYSKYSL